MSLTPGDHIGQFEVVALVGEGGMGRVYRARDQKLARTVAVKVLPDAFARDAERLARFRREAQALAALNDPHIAQIYQLEESLSTGSGQAGQRAALVMEFVEGQTIADAILAKSIDVDDAVRLAGEIAAGLESAHEKGIIHRDLKPANVKITADGHAKILDFGLAKAMAGDSAFSEVMNSPTLTARATEAGVILGTAAYMSPEQARGKAVDKRTDIWAFGAVLYEMLTGRRAFEGETVSDTLASVLRSDPDWSRLPADVPPHVRPLLVRCLERDATRRLRDIGEARLALGAGAPPATIAHQLASATSSTTSAPSARHARPWPWIAATVVLALALAASLLRPREAATGAESVELAIGAPVGTDFEIGANSGVVVLSPDGTKIAFVASNAKSASIWVRSLARDDARMLSGTEGASNQFWSPDSRKLGFFAGGKLRTADIAGGLPEAIADAAFGRGGAWSEDGVIIFAPTGGSALSRVSATGGTPTPLTTLDLTRGENAHYWPSFLPDGKRYLYLVRSTLAENSGIYLGHLDGSPARRLIPSLSSAIVARRGPGDEWFLLWVRDHDLLAQRFDLASAALSGDVSTIASGVRVEESQLHALVSASRHGHLAWATSRAAEHALALRSRDGRLIRWLDLPAGRNVQPVLSPNDTQVLFTRVERGIADIYRHDLKTGVTDRITTDPDYDESPVWSASGRAFTYRGFVRGKRAVLRLELSSGARPVVVATDVQTAGTETPDGRHIILQVNDGGVVKNLAYAIPDFKVSVPVGNVPAGTAIAAVSPDGWAFVGSTAYTQAPVALARLETRDGGFSLGPPQVAAEGVIGATSRRDGKELFVTMPDGHLRAIAITKTGTNVSFGAPVTLFRLPPGSDTLSVNADGTQFVIAETPNTVGQTIRVLTNWESRVK
jgi:Tol biopolymer transport system component